MTARIIPARELTRGPALIVFRLPGRPGRTIRSRVAMVAHEAGGIVRVAFTSGDIVSLDARAVVGVLSSPPPRARPRRAAR